MLNAKGEVLVVSQHGVSWSLPKGHIDPGEDAKTKAAEPAKGATRPDELAELKSQLATMQAKLEKLSSDGK